MRTSRTRRISPTTFSHVEQSMCTFKAARRSSIQQTRKQRPRGFCERSGIRVVVALRNQLVGRIAEENTFLEEDHSQRCLSRRTTLDGRVRRTQQRPMRNAFLEERRSQKSARREDRGGAHVPGGRPLSDVCLDSREKRAAV